MEEVKDKIKFAIAESFPSHAQECDHVRYTISSQHVDYYKPSTDLTVHLPVVITEHLKTIRLDSGIFRTR